MSREIELSAQKDVRRLAELSAEIGRISAELSHLAEHPDPPERGAVSAELVRGIIRARRLRTHFLSPSIFEDPAWDMLLDLMAARLEKQRVAVSSLCIAAAVPPTSALRWIKTLCDQGLVVRVADQEDGRRVFIELSEKTADAIDAYIRAAQRVSPLAI